MNIRKLLSLAAFAALSALSLSANAVQVSFSFDQTNSTSNYGYGSFTGTDSNNDNLLTFNELTSFTSDLPPEVIFGLSLAELRDFGSFNLVTNLWNADAFGWGNTNFAWYSWNNGVNSVNPEWATMRITSVTNDGTVPEPASLALLGIALAGAGFARRRKA